MRNNLQTAFKSLMEKLEIKEPKSNVEKFNDWMVNKVKSIYLPDNEQMCNAFERIIEN